MQVQSIEAPFILKTDGRSLLNFSTGLLFCTPVLGPDFYWDIVRCIEHRRVADSVPQFAQGHLLDFQDRLMRLEAGPIQPPKVLHQASIPPSPQDFQCISQTRRLDQQMDRAVPGSRPRLISNHPKPDLT